MYLHDPRVYEIWRRLRPLIFWVLLVKVITDTTDRLDLKHSRLTIRSAIIRHGGTNYNTDYNR